MLVTRNVRVLEEHKLRFKKTQQLVILGPNNNCRLTFGACVQFAKCLLSSTWGVRKILLIPLGLGTQTSQLFGLFCVALS